MKKLLLSTLAAAAVLASATSFADNNTKIGIVDMRQVLQNSSQVVAVQNKLKQEFGSRQTQLQAAQDQLQKDAEKLNRDGAVMTASDRDALVKKAQGEQQNLRNMQMSYQKDLYTQQTQQMQTILTHVQSVIAKVAKDKQLSLVLAKDSVPYAAEGLDITPDVIKEVK